MIDYSGMFENDVKMYGTQTVNVFLISSSMFENDVKMYGTQTVLASEVLTSVFENDVVIVVLNGKRAYWRRSDMPFSSFMLLPPRPRGNPIHIFKSPGEVEGVFVAYGGANIPYR